MLESVTFTANDLKSKNTKLMMLKPFVDIISFQLFAMICYEA